MYTVSLGFDVCFWPFLVHSLEFVCQIPGENCDQRGEFPEANSPKLRSNSWGSQKKHQTKHAQPRYTVEHEEEDDDDDDSGHLPARQYIQ